jgi:hypothetical protein
MLSYRDYMQNDPQQLRKWVESFSPNLPMSLGFLQAGGYDPIAMQSSKQAVRELARQLPLQEKLKTSSEYSGQLARMNVKYLVTFTARPLRPAHGLSLFFTSDWQQDGFRVRVYRNDRFTARLQASPVGAVSWQELSPNQIQAETLAPAEGTTLTLRDTAYPAWRAYSNGHRVSMQPTAAGYRAITLAPHTTTERGSTDHKIALVYDSNSFRVGLFCALLGLAALAFYRCITTTQGSSEYS